MRFRARRLYRFILVGVVATAGLLVALDIVLLQVFESRAGTGLAQQTAAQRGSVDLGGFPFLPAYMRERLDRVDVEALGMTRAGLRVDKLALEMSDVTFDRRRARRLARSIYRTRMQVTGNNVIGRFEIVERDLSEFIRSRSPGVREVRITTSGVEISFGEDAQAPPARYLPVLRP